MISRLFRSLLRIPERPGVLVPFRRRRTDRQLRKLRRVARRGAERELRKMREAS